MGRQLLTVWTALSDVAVTHAWTGFTGFPFEFLPHIGQPERAYCAMGYCGHGVSLAPYLGDKLALRVVAGPESAMVFGELPYTARSARRISTASGIATARARPRDVVGDNTPRRAEKREKGTRTTRCTCSGSVRFNSPPSVSSQGWSVQWELNPPG